MRDGFFCFVTGVTSQKCRRAPRGSYVNPLRISDTGLVRVPGILCPKSYKLIVQGAKVNLKHGNNCLFSLYFEVENTKLHVVIFYTSCSIGPGQKILVQP